MQRPALPAVRSLTALTLVAAVAASRASEKPPDTGLVGLEPLVDSYVGPYVETDDFSGAVLIARHGEVLLAKGYGLAHRELSVPATPRTVFHLASISKPFTAAAILLLQEDGRLAVSDPVGRHVPGLAWGDRVTLHQLLVHTSGIPNINGFDDYGDIQLRPQTPESLVARFAELPLAFEPGERYDYSNSNYNLLALVVERSSGLAFGEFLQRRIFGPLGMTSTTHHGDAGAILPGAAAGYAPAGLGLARAPWIDWSAKTGNGSLVSTVGDLLLFERGLHEGRLLSAASLEATFTDHVDGAGYGWFVRQRHGRRQVHINGRSPGFGGYLGAYPDEGLTVILLGNVYNSVTTPMGVDLAGLVLGEAVEAPDFGRRPLAPEETARIVGSYRFGEDFYSPGWVMEVRAEDGYLFNGDDWLIPRSERTMIHRRYWSELRFEAPDEAGRYTRVDFDGYPGERLPDAAPQP